MSTKTLPKENFFLLKETKPSYIYKGMDSPKQIYARFYDALKQKEDDHGSGFNKFINGKTGISTGFLSLVLSGKKKASQQSQINICNACNLDYQSFFSEPTNNIKPNQKSSQEIQDVIALYKEIITLKDEKIERLEAQLSEKIRWPNTVKDQGSKSA
jgi:hypothetical protein